MASIRKRADRDGGGYQVRYYSPDGKRHAKSFKTRREAVAFSNSVETDIARGSWNEPSAMSTKLSEFIQGYLDSGVHWRPASRVKVQGHIQNYVLPAFGDSRMTDIRPQDVREWIVALSKHGLAPATVRGIYSSLSRIMRQAEIDGVITRSPCLGVALPHEHTGRDIVFLDARQIAALASEIDERFAALIFTAAYTGARWGELAALKVKNVDLEKGTIRITESVSEVNGYLHEGLTKTGKQRVVSVPRFLCSMLAHHVTRFSSGGYVFTSAEGKPLRRTFYRRHFLPAAKAAGMAAGLRFHDLRHSCAALLIAQGAHPKEIQERLGHSTIRMTFDRYGHLFPSLDERLREGLDAAFEAAQNHSMGEGQ
jgi:integrase